MIDYIVGLAGLPISVIIFLNMFGITNIQSIFGINILLIAAIMLVIIQIANVAGAHVAKEHITISYITCGVSLFPAILYFISGFVTLPETLVVSFPAMLASFIFVEGTYSFYIG
jgi:hypothetical protein